MYCLPKAFLFCVLGNVCLHTHTHTHNVMIKWILFRLKLNRKTKSTIIVWKFSAGELYRIFVVVASHLFKWNQFCYSELNYVTSNSFASVRLLLHTNFSLPFSWKLYQILDGEHSSESVHLRHSRLTEIGAINFAYHNKKF